ncbi:MAG: radical SAM protein [Pirellulales bacterium]
MSIPKKNDDSRTRIHPTLDTAHDSCPNSSLPRIYRPSSVPPHVPQVSSEAKLLHHPEHIHGITTGRFLPPIMVDIDPVDGVCNLDCTWCCQAQSRSARPAKFMNQETMLRLGPFCKDWGVKSWRISGDSEPLLNRNINTLIRSGYESDIDIGLITNGVFLDRVTTFSNLTYLGVSLDATTASTWSKVKNSTPQGFDTIINNIKRIRNEYPCLDLCLKFVRFHAKKSLNKNQFSESLSIINENNGSEADNYVEAEEMEDFAKNLGCRPIIRDAYPENLAKTYKFDRCHVTPMGGVFDASHQFHLCCDARSIYVLTDDYTRDDWQELPRLWGSDRHKTLIENIQPVQCVGCAKNKMNEIFEHVVMTSDNSQEYQRNFI